ncbi:MULTISPECIES: TonB-dependent receptor [unclassified Spirosoma]|uniref:TonB-dependent receptor n=1 Tax=unclassified Spirosoma TaxID=2621999 RepID=UPI000966ED78|nr:MULTISPECIES: TonB-dependent receptor [unclassified Spirosoma]MBN8825548.1 TonB-dependent receptor [Spirosoma sp.]OJW74203.1 MAG: TonB-dependent receptor [Spirosoma sp. 48-14]
MKALFTGMMLVISGLLPSYQTEAQTAPSQSSTIDSSKTQLVRGRVSELVNSKTIPLVGATVIWAGTSSGSVTDTDGHFQLPIHTNSKQLVISYVGYRPDTLLVTNPATHLDVTLRSERTLQEVTVSGAPGQIDRINPIQTEFINQRTLAKAACCNLSESFETNASVSVSYSDAVTGAKQIQFLGLGGQYVQTNVENIPNVRGLATTFGLNYIPGTWITSIDVGKGAGSVVNGYESMSGQMNVELQKPDDKQTLFLNGYINSFGRVEGNINWSKPLVNKRNSYNYLWPGQKDRSVSDPKWSMGVLGHASTLRNEIDQNNDGFRDLPLYTQVNVINRYKYNGEKYMAQFGVKALYEDRDGGQLSSFGDTRYRFLNTTKRLEFFSKTAKLYLDKPYKGLGLILNGVHHEQSARFGFAPYEGRQQTFYANLIYQSIIGNTNNAFKAGLSYLLDDYSEHYKTIQTARTESVPGAFVEYTYTYPEKLTLVLGGRLDFHNLFGTQLTPRAHLKYNPSQHITFRASAGRGFRAANPFAENFGYLVSSRAVYLNQPLQFESSWNYGVSLTNDFQVLGKKASLVLDYHRTDFQNQLIVDIEHPGKLYFYNLAEAGGKARSFANSFQAELNVQPARRFEVKAAYRLFDVEQSMGGPFGEERLLPKMMISRERVLLNAGYALPFDKWKFDATLQWNGPRRIPYLRDGYVHTSYQNMPVDMAPSFYNLNAQLSRAFRSGWEIYLGGENLTGFRQLNPIVAANDPFGPRFDAGSQVWGPITGRMVYAGFRFKPQP